MRFSQLVLCSIACLLPVAKPLSAQSADGQVGELPFNPSALALCDLPVQAIAPGLVLQEGTQVRLQFVEYTSTRTTKRDDRVRFRAVSDVSVEGLTIIPAGADAWGIVTLARKPGHFSRDGKLEIAFEKITLLNGQTIAIRSPLKTQAMKWDWRSPDSLQAPLLALFAPVIVAIMPRDDRQKLIISTVKGIVSKGNHAERLEGMRAEAVISRTVELDREQFRKLQPAALEQKTPEGKSGASLGGTE